VIVASLALHHKSEGSRLPNSCNKTEARRKGALKVSKHDHGRLLDEISIMEILNFVEEEDDIRDCSRSDGEQSLDDDTESSDSETSDS
jgi:hypothetical protein